MKAPIELIQSERPAPPFPLRRPDGPEVYGSATTLGRAWEELNLTGTPPDLDFDRDWAVIVPVEIRGCAIDLQRIVPSESRIELQYVQYIGECGHDVDDQFDVYRVDRGTWPDVPEVSVHVEDVPDEVLDAEPEIPEVTSSR